MMKEPWKNWENKTKQEEDATRSLEETKRIVLENIPNEQIVAMYVGGSFTRREMDKKSDIDTWTIVKDHKYVAKLQKLHEQFRDRYKPEIGISGYSLKELESGKTIGKKLRANPGRFLKKLEDYVLLYGRPLDINKFPIRSDLEDLRNLASVMKSKFIPSYESKGMGFSGLIKQIFWLTELEEKVAGKKPPYSFQGLVDSISDANHIIHDALKYRLKPTKDKRKRKYFVNKLKKHLGDLNEN